MVGMRGWWAERCTVVARVLACLLLAGLVSETFAGKPGGNQPPVVQLTSPANGESFVAPASISLAASASDPNGSVTRVDFYQGNTLIGTATAAPYTATWSDVGTGTYTITVKATDNAGAVTTSAPASITVASAAALVVTSPANGSSLHVFSPLTVSGTFEGPEGSTIVVDNEQSSILATITGNTYTATFWYGQRVSIGANKVTVRLARPDGTSASRTITVNGYDHPYIAFTAPSCDTFDAPANILLAVDAKVPGGTVTQVEFYRGSTLLATVMAPPYQFSWTNVTPGTHNVSAVVTSSFGARTEKPIQIRVLGANSPPTISITAPTPGATFTAPASIPIAVNTSDPDIGGSVKTVEYFANSTLFGVSSVPPFSTTWVNVAAGTYSLTARATDDRNGQTDSAPVSVTVVPPNQPPVVSLTAPLEGATFTAPATIPSTAAVSDPDGSISQVEFYQGTTLLGTVTSGPYAFNWTNVPAGTYSLTARATDNLGAVTASAAVSVTVSPSSLSITSPASGAVVNGNAVVVSGTFVGTGNTGITVNGVIAVTDGANNFYAHDVPLQPGSNTLIVKHSTLTGETASQSVVVSSDGAVPEVQISARPLSGVAPLTTRFTVRNTSAEYVTVQLNGSPVSVLPAGEEGNFTVTLDNPASFSAAVTVNGGAISAGKEFTLVAKDGESVNQMFQGLWTGLSAQLTAGNIAQALTYFDPDVRSSYQSVFARISVSLPTMFATPPRIHPKDLSGEYDVEYLTIVQRDGTNYGHFLYFSQGEDGVWRLSSL